MLGRHDVLVARGAVDGPPLGHPLAGCDDLLDEQQPVVADQGPQSLEVGARLGETVDVVHAHAGEGRMPGQTAGEGVHHLGHLDVLDAHGDEVVDREEPSDVATGITPPGQFVVLTGDGLGDVELLGPRGEREAQGPVPQLRTAVARRDLETAVGEDLVERRSELRHDHATAGEVPVHVEPAGRRRRPPVAQHRPPRIVAFGLGDRHVVGDVVDDHAEPVLVRGVEQPLQCVVAAELLPDPGVVDDVVPVAAVGDRLGDRRQVEVRDPERHDRGQDGDGVVEPEVGGELEAVRRDRRRGGGV